MLAEMEFTGQAFEEMQEQNIRLMQQLREKDDSNLKLMSEVSIVSSIIMPCNLPDNWRMDVSLQEVNSLFLEIRINFR